MAKRSTAFLRINDWWIGKASPLLMLVYLYSYLLEISFHKFLLLIAASLTVIVGFASFGYMVNDWFDRVQDRLADKKNIFQNKSIFTATFYFASSLLTMSLPWTILPHNVISYSLIAFELSLFIVYSVSPVRLKERRFLGPVVDALYAHAVPSLLALHTFQLAAEKSLPVYFIFVLILWQFFIGFRNILIHQMNDAEHDKKAGVKNWSATMGIKKLWFVIHALVVAEVLLLSYIIYFAFINAGLLQWASLSALLFSFFVYLLYQRKVLAAFETYINWKNFPNFFYEYFMPLSVLTSLMLFDRDFSIIAIFHALLFFLPASFSLLQFIVGIYHSISFIGIFLTYFYIPLRRLMSFTFNNFLYYLFRCFGVDLIKEKMSATDYLKKKMNEN